MADPIGHLFGRLLTGWFGFVLGEKIERQREEHAQLNDERINFVANRVYSRLYGYLSKVSIGTKSQKFQLKDILGEPELSRFSLEVAEWVRRELQQQP